MNINEVKALFETKLETTANWTTNQCTKEFEFPQTDISEEIWNLVVNCLFKENDLEDYYSHHVTSGSVVVYEL